MSDVVNKITINQLKENPPKIEKKFLLIDSSLYTDKAYEYLLEIINSTDSIAFIIDRRQIYTHGEYFGGDLWEDTFCYFAKFQILDENDNIISTLKSETQKEILKLKGINNIKLIPEEEIIDGIKYKTIKFGFDIDKSIDKELVSIDDSTAQYGLDIKNDKIILNKYIPIRIEYPNIDFIEYDSTNRYKEYDINIIGTDDNKNVIVTSDKANVNLSDDYKKISASFTGGINETIKYLVLYTDSRTQGAIEILQKYGFANIYSNVEITKENFKTFNRYLSEDNCKGNINLNIDDNYYGWFGCPSFLTPKFRDKDTNIIGGWKKYKTINLYSLNIEYTIYRTENSGLGNTNWEII